MQKMIALTTGRPPTRRALYQDPELSKRIPQLKSLLEDFKRAVPRPTTPVYVPLSNIMQRYFSSALALQDSDINAHAALAARDMNRVLDLLRGHVAP
jgi:multiple sugar transport system substrate-binding protein